jgi:cytoskeleton protein RodZ
LSKDVFEIPSGDGMASHAPSNSNSQSDLSTELNTMPRVEEFALIPTEAVTSVAEPADVTAALATGPSIKEPDMTLRDKSLHVVHSQNAPRNPDGTLAPPNQTPAALPPTAPAGGDMRDGVFNFTNNAGSPPPASMPAPAQGSAQPGAILKAARERQGLSVGDLATRLRMSVRQVEAIETDHYEALPKGPFLRGFMRNYAKVVGVDVNEILSLLDRTELGASTALRAATIAVPNQNIKVNGSAPRAASKLRLGVTVGVLLLLLAAVAYWWQYVRPNLATGGRPTPVAVQTADGSSVTTVPVAPPSIGNVAGGATNASTAPAPLPSADPASASSKLAVPPAGAGPPVTGTGSGSAPADASAQQAITSPPILDTVPPQVAAATPAGLRNSANAATVTSLDARGQPIGTSSLTTPQSAADAAAVATQAPPVPAGSSRVGFTFTGRSWVEVVDARGRTILSKRYEAGDADDVVGRPPFSIVVGNAQVTRMAYNGKPFDLEPHTRVTVARVTVK